MTIFEKVIAREIPAKIIWEDDDAIAFHDVNPQAPVHVLIVPKKAIPRLAAATESERAILTTRSRCALHPSVKAASGRAAPSARVRGFLMLRDKPAFHARSL